MKEKEKKRADGCGEEEGTRGRGEGGDGLSFFCSFFWNLQKVRFPFSFSDVFVFFIFFSFFQSSEQTPKPGKSSKVPIVKHDDYPVWKFEFCASVDKEKGPRMAYLRVTPLSCVSFLFFSFVVLFFFFF